MTMLPANPARAQALWTHLATWGEVAAHEAQVLDATDWLTVLAESGVLDVARDAQSQPVAWYLRFGFAHLLDTAAGQTARWLCFATPGYRAYLVGILAEGLVDAARAGMALEIEQWTAAELSALNGEINALLDGLEEDHRLVDLPAPELEERFARLPGRVGGFAAWDAFALGQAAQPKALFEFALRRFGPSSQPLPVVDERPAVLRTLPLNREDGFDLSQAPIPQAWNTQRFGVLGGVAVFDSRGSRRIKGAESNTGQLLDHLRDALVEHPFYAAVIQLAICAWRSPASTMPTVELYLPKAGSLYDLSALVGSRGVGRLADLLGDLVRAQGYAPFGLVNGRVPDALMDNLLRNLLELRILRHQDELLVLDEGYQASLMSARLRTVFRPGKVLQARMVDVLASRASEGDVT